MKKIEVNISEIQKVSDNNKSISSPVNYQGLEIHSGNSPGIWRKTKGTGVKVAVIDVGISPKIHTFTSVKLENCYNLKNPDLQFQDLMGHSTGVVSIISASHDLSNRMWGVAPDTEVSIIDVGVYDSEKEKYLIDVKDLCQAIVFACEGLKVDIINLSLGMNQHSKRIERYINYYASKGIVFIAGAGNDNDKGQIDFPARLEKVLGIGGYDYKQSDSGNVDFSAKGSQVHFINVNGNILVNSKGTSYSSAIVTGYSALLLSELKMENSCQPINYRKKLKEKLKVFIEGEIFSPPHPVFGVGKLNLFK